MTKSFKEMQGIKEACWVGYKQVGMKKKGDRMVPNCVKEEVVDAVFGKDYVYQENYQDMYKGKLNKDQIATIKNTWAGKKENAIDAQEAFIEKAKANSLATVAGL